MTITLAKGAYDPPWCAPQKAASGTQGSQAMGHDGAEQVELRTGGATTSRARGRIPRGLGGSCLQQGFGGPPSGPK